MFASRPRRREGRIMHDRRRLRPARPARHDPTRPNPTRRCLRSTAADVTVNRTLAAEVPVKMLAILRLVDTVISIYIWLLIAQAVLSWLVAFGIVNRHNRVVAMVGDFLWRITEPLLRPIRRILPDLGGIDVSPVILILLLYFLRNLMFEYLA
jgi:YggT family protein